MEPNKHYKIPYKPRPIQRDFHAKAPRFSVCVMHRRAGKTVMAVNELLKRGLMCKWPRPQCAMVGPTYQQVERISWQYLKLFAGVIPGVKFNEAKLRCEIPLGDERGNLTIYLIGAENPDALRGLYFDFVCLDEFGMMRPAIWTEVLRPSISDRPGAGAMWIGTPKGFNNFYDRYELARKNMENGDPDWLAVKLTAEDTGVLAKKELEAARSEMSPDEYEQEYMCSFSAAIKGAYFAAEMERAESDGRIGSVPYDPKELVNTSWDLGYRDATAIIFFTEPRPGRELHIIDYYEASGEGLDHYLQVLSLKPYVYDQHYMPHDVRVHELSSGTSRWEMMREKGISGKVAPKLKKPDQIEAARRELGICHFDQDKCHNLIGHLKHYRKQWDDKLGVFRATPLHDEHSNGADAFQILAISKRSSEAAVDLAFAARTGRLPDGRPVLLRTADADIFS